METFLKLLLKKKKNIVVFQNNDDLSYFIKKKIIEKEQSVLIPGLGVNTKYFTPMTKIKKKYDLIMHSRMLIDKGVYDLINAIKILKRKEIKLTVLLLGSPDEKNRASIKKEYLKHLDKRKIICWIPSKPNVLSYIQQSKIGKQVPIAVSVKP